MLPKIDFRPRFQNATLSTLQEAFLKHCLKSMTFFDTSKQRLENALYNYRQHFLNALKGVFCCSVFRLFLTIPLLTPNEPLVDRSSTVTKTLTLILLLLNYFLFHDFLLDYATWLNPMFIQTVGVQESLSLSLSDGSHSPSMMKYCESQHIMTHTKINHAY